MARVAAIVILDNLDDRDSLIDWSDERELPLAWTSDQLLIAEIADSLPVDHHKNLLVEFKGNG